MPQWKGDEGGTAGWTAQRLAVMDGESGCRRSGGRRRAGRCTSDVKEVRDEIQESRRGTKADFEHADEAVHC